MKVGEIMTTKVITVAGDTPVPQIAALLRENRISGVPVVDADGVVVGLVSEHDLLARGGEVARDVMTSSVISVTVDTDVDDVRHLLVERRIRRVPVTSGSRLAGIVSRGDVIALLTTEWVCGVCGEAARGIDPPARCPKCHAAPDRFSVQEPSPGP
jgi:CBS domain-containing protein